ncbi:MAG: putative porin [Verrucomicrobiia bacterium]
MKTLKKQNTRKNVALFAGATALMALTPQLQAQTSVDALLNKLEQKGILTVDEAKELKAENQQDSAADLNKAINSRFQMPDYVTSIKLYGDFRGRVDDQASTDGNKSFVDRTRYRYRLRAGLVISMKDNLETGFSITSGDSAPTTPSGYSGGGGQPLSNNSTLQDNGTKKNVYIDTAYGKWTALNSDGWLLSATIGKMYNPLQFTPMVFDSDWTPEGAALQGGYTFNDQQAILVNLAAFVEDQEVGGGDTGSVRAPGLFGGQAIWNANWTESLASSLGLGGYLIVNPGELTTANVPYVNQGNTRIWSNTGVGTLVNDYAPIIADASVTYKLDSFPLYPGKFPIKLAGEYINNVGAKQNNNNNQGCWVGVMFGKSGKKHAWDISYRYEYLEADAVYDQLVDDDNGAYYQYLLANNGGAVGYFGGTNLKGNLIKANYSLADALTFSITCYLNQLINPGLNAQATGEPNNSAMHLMADLMWKF